MIKIIISRLIGSIISLILGCLIFLYFGNLFLSNNHDLKNNCKVCSFFDKACSYTDEELLKEEYDYSSPCSDMGAYELKFKLFGGLSMIGITIMVVFPIVFLFGKK